MTNIIAKILAPIIAAFAAIMALMDLISTLNDIKTGIEIATFAVNTTTSIVQTYNDFAVWRTGIENQTLSFIFIYAPILQNVPPIGWDLLKVGIFITIFLYVIDWCSRNF